MLSDKSLLEILKRVCVNTLAVVAFIFLCFSWMSISFLETKWLEESILSITVLHWLYLVLTISGVIVFLVLVIILRKEAKVSEPFRNLLEKYNPTELQLLDLDMFLGEKRNIMDADQLASAQLSAMNIIVVSPQPLELTSQKVIESTSEWLKLHRGDEKAFIEYWSTSRFGDNPPVLSVISKLIAMAGNKEILKRIKCVTVPDELLLIDFTIWVFDDNKLRAFANDKGVEGNDYRLWELHWNTAQTMYEVLTLIKSNGTATKLKIPYVSRDGTSAEIERVDITYVPHGAIEKLRTESEK